MPPIEHDVEEVDDEFKLVNYITLRRIYDVLLGIYSNINEAEADKLVLLHQQGIFASPPPAWKPGRD